MLLITKMIKEIVKGAKKMVKVTKETANVRVYLPGEAFPYNESEIINAEFEVLD